MLKVKNLHTWHGHNHSLKGVSLHVPGGSLVAVVGANGAGKSTLLGTIAGVYNCLEGEVLLEGRPIQNLSPDRVVKQGICLVPERRQIFDSLSVEDNLLLGAYKRWRGNKQGVRSDLDNITGIFPDLIPRLQDHAGQLSGGMQQMLAIGRGLMAKPKLIQLDEPSLGLAPLMVRKIYNTLHELKKQGTTILLIEQNARVAMQVADWVYVMDQGEIVLEGEPDLLQQESKIRQAYLGKNCGSPKTTNNYACQPKDLAFQS